MPKKRYTPEMEAARRKVAAAHQRKMEVRAGIEERLRLEVEKELMTLDIAESLAANEALALGVTGTDVTAALGIGNWHKYRSILALTQLHAMHNQLSPRPDWTVNYEDAEEPVSVTFWRYPDKTTGQMVDGEATFPVERINKYGGIDLDRFARPGVDLVVWDWLMAKWLDWSRGHRHAPESEGGTAPGLALAVSEPSRADDDYFKPRAWNPSMDEEDA